MRFRLPRTCSYLKDILSATTGGGMMRSRTASANHPYPCGIPNTHPVRQIIAYQLSLRLLDPNPHVQTFQSSIAASSEWSRYIRAATPFGAGRLWTSFFRQYTNLGPRASVNGLATLEDPASGRAESQKGLRLIQMDVKSCLSPEEDNNFRFNSWTITFNKGQYEMYSCTAADCRAAVAISTTKAAIPGSN